MREGTGVSLAIGALLSASFTAIAGVVVGVTYLFVCLYAIVKWIVDADGHPDPTTIVVGFVVLVPLLVLVVLVATRMLGRSLVTRRRTDD